MGPTDATRTDRFNRVPASELWDTADNVYIFSPIGIRLDRKYSSDGLRGIMRRGWRRLCLLLSLGLRRLLRDVDSDRIIGRNVDAQLLFLDRNTVARVSTRATLRTFGSNRT